VSTSRKALAAETATLQWLPGLFESTFEQGLGWAEPSWGRRRPGLAADRFLLGPRFGPEYLSRSALRRAVLLRVRRPARGRQTLWRESWAPGRSCLGLAASAELLFRVCAILRWLAVLACQANPPVVSESVWTVLRISPRDWYCAPLRSQFFLLVFRLSQRALTSIVEVIWIIRGLFRIWKLGKGTWEVAGCRGCDLSGWVSRSFLGGPGLSGRHIPLRAIVSTYFLSGCGCPRSGFAGAFGACQVMVGAAGFAGLIRTGGSAIATMSSLVAGPDVPFWWRWGGCGFACRGHRWIGCQIGQLVQYLFRCLLARVLRARVPLGWQLQCHWFSSLVRFCYLRQLREIIPGS